mmetsp:Transcript_36447/g.55950  ORF Transcript_36447/g.55950 Transcript_36447/m.55950 type:complete len:207 (-) Transcript_36447:330-950(-)
MVVDDSETTTCSAKQSTAAFRDLTEVDNDLPFEHLFKKEKIPGVTDKDRATTFYNIEGLGGIEADKEKLSKHSTFKKRPTEKEEEEDSEESDDSVDLSGMTLLERWKYKIGAAKLQFLKMFDLIPPTDEEIAKMEKKEAVILKKIKKEQEQKKKEEAKQPLFKTPREVSISRSSKTTETTKIGSETSESRTTVEVQGSRNIVAVSR